MMNLNKLFEMQRELDKHIEREHPRGFAQQERIEDKILALQVELGECANEWRGFKFWSKDQQPRTQKLDSVFVGHGPSVFISNPLLEEYVDCLHFILSIGEEYYTCYIDAALPFRVELPNEIEPVKYNSVRKQFNYLFNQVGYMMDCACDCEMGTDTETAEQYTSLFQMFIGLGEMLGFTWEQIEEAYLAKNAENHKRQESGY